MDVFFPLLILIIILCFIVYLVINGRFSSDDQHKGETDESIVVPKTSRKLDIRGEAGESIIMSKISREISKGLHGYVLRNLYLPKVDGGTSEVDVVLICSKGIFVFESKNYAGWIFGNDKNRYWTVVLFTGRGWSGLNKSKKHRFYNPIWQNNTHVNCLKRVVGNSYPIESVVVFTDRCELKDITNNSNTIVMRSDMLKYYLSSIRNSQQDALTPDEVENIYCKLLQYTDSDKEKKQNHIEYVNELQNNPSKCPRCGGNLIVRTVKKGNNAGRQFYGCSNYPKCKYTRNVKN